MARAVRYPTTGTRLNDLKGAVLIVPAFPLMRWAVPFNVTYTSWRIINLHNGSVVESPHYNTLCDWVDQGTVMISHHLSPTEHEALLVSRRVYASI